MAKETFDIDVVMKRVAEAVRPFPKAAMFELAEKGHDSPFEQLVGCILSIRTYDEVSLPVSLKLFARARTPQQMATLNAAEIARIIHRSSFSERKAEQIKAIAHRLVDEFEGKLPCDRDLILSFKGVGPKCANLALGIACGQKVISVDIHVHRITNRWGYVAEKTPEKTMVALQNKLPKRYWIDINRLLVPFGKHICTASRPRCTTCPLFAICPRVGVKSYR
ncbi:endonuclease III domain-containing protein [Candidatus Leptofilum sp.]|uniref:endonuclease III domain-containing protein n=1 Tax=Candidatus Leptofilum sp. TaxID=3241576 RepID=UPI003B5998EE